MIEGDVAAQQAIRFNIFQLNQTYTGKDERLNIGPKGFTGEKYGGSTYWDTHADGEVRFTRKGNTLYAIALEWPEDDLKLTSLAGKDVVEVHMLGLQEPVKWKQNSDGLTIQPPAKRPCRYAYTFKIVCRSL